MSMRIRGQEVSIRFTVDGRRMRGSLERITDFTATERGEIKETDFIGEAVTDLDYQHHGWDFSFTAQIQDESVLALLDDIVNRELTHQAYPVITMSVTYAFREPGAINKTEVYRGVYLRPQETGFSGRKEYVTTKFEGKAKRRVLANAA